MSGRRRLKLSFAPRWTWRTDDKSYDPNDTMPYPTMIMPGLQKWDMAEAPFGTVPDKAFPMHSYNGISMVVQSSKDTVMDYTNFVVIRCYGRRNGIEGIQRPAMNFTEAEKKECWNLLNKLNDEVILSLTNTVTGRSIQVSSREEAIDAILSFSKSASELLSRKKITRDYLKQYLFSQQVSVSGSSTKQDLISQILEYWSGERISYPAVQSPPREQTHLAEPKPRLPSGDVKQLGETFASWFYELFNSGTESGLKDQLWPRCSLHLLLISEGIDDERIEGADLVACRLKRLVSEENLHFNANITGGGVTSQGESFGIVCVVVRGTVHKGDHVLGLFEQKFDLLRDPSNSKSSNEFHRSGEKDCRNLLNQLDYKDILSLANTVTGKSKRRSRKEAIDAILSFSMSASELLSRQKITRYCLKQYLFSQQVSVSGSSTKQDLISRILEYWSGERISYPAVQSPPREQTHLAEPETRLLSTSDVKFGETFASKFYKLFNSGTESGLKDQFWPQCSLHLLLISEVRNEERTEGADLVACRLKRLVNKENLYFNANITGGGVTSQVVSFGIVSVTVHGRVHKGDHVLGDFEQKFDLLRDPTLGINWKITCASLKVARVPLDNQDSEMLVDE
ncbi:Hypothetical predicted protein [Octopus vulgaris]|uniref:Uncharacterized protein n=1 Tax=Octopus vulgaris TaxID=6645 RepID=A0AA36BC44_OCTVU|nr:Hypothetical predicted protein [Octopus vulgaris]